MFNSTQKLSGLDEVGQADTCSPSRPQFAGRIIFLVAEGRIKRFKVNHTNIIILILFGKSYPMRAKLTSPESCDPLDTCA